MHDEAADPELNAAQRKLVGALSTADVNAIDESLLSASTRTWRKVAFVVGTAMISLQRRFPGIPDVYFSQRVAALVDSGKLIAQGNLRRMRFSEVRLVDPRADET